MQFIDSFITVTQQGLDEEYYSILDNIEKIDDSVSDEWKEIVQQIVDQEAKQFIKECIKKNIIPPTIVGYEMETGEIAELEWDNLDIVYLTNEQMKYKDAFIEKGFDVVSSIDDFEKITNV